MFCFKKLWLISFLVFFNLTLGACGGGGGTDDDSTGDGNDNSSGDENDGSTDDEVVLEFEGFLKLVFAEGNSWDYFWTYDDDYPLDGITDEFGTVTVTLGSASQQSIPNVGTITMHSVSYTGLDDFALVWDEWSHIGVHQGVIYGRRPGGGIEALFDARDGSVEDDGFVGYFSNSRQETASSVTFMNSGGDSLNAVEVSEPFFDPDCQTISGVTVCDGQFDDYQVKEYFSADFGFVGFHRSGTSVFSGVGPGIFSSNMNVSLSETSVGCNPLDREPNNSMSDIAESPLSFHSLCPGVEITGVFNTSTDPEDWFTYRSYDGDVSIGADAGTSGRANGQVHIHVYDANGILINNTDLNPGDPGLFSMDFDVNPGQLLFIRVEAIDSLGGDAQYSVRLF